MGRTRKLSALVVYDEPSLVRVVEGYLIKTASTYGPLPTARQPSNSHGSPNPT